MKNIKKVLLVTTTALGVGFIGLKIIAKIKEKDRLYENVPSQKNPLEGKKVIFVEDENDSENADGERGHLEAVGDAEYQPTFYDKYIKRGFDLGLSFGGLVALSPILAGITIAIKIDDPGPVLFTQKRLGQNKKYFKLYKFRSMKMSTPHDTPTHILENPDQYITRIGKFLRAHSLDELPQLFNVFCGDLSLVGARPGLWNQEVLTAERDKYGVNELKPGITGWAQINGRDSVSLQEKALLDKYYVEHKSLMFDLKCLLGTVLKVGHDDTVVEGGTGSIGKTGRHYADSKSEDELIGNIGFGEPVEVDKQAQKRVLITGAGSYIGESFAEYAKVHYCENFEIETIDMQDVLWREKDFSGYDIVYHVAGIAHADVGNVSEEIKEKYYVVNTDLAIETAKKAKEDGVKEFIFMSSMIVHGDSAPFGKEKIIKEHTVPTPANFYGDSKLQADVAVRQLADNSFKVIVLRPPMIYGKGSKGNYSTLSKLAKKLPVFPNVDNERSMLHIDNLCEFLCQIMLIKEVKQNAIVLIPQNSEWTKTADMVKEIAKVSGKNIAELKVMRLAVAIGGKVPGKIGSLVNKAFGNSCYAHEMSVYDGIDYQKMDLRTSIIRTEGNGREESDSKEDDSTRMNKKHILVVSQYFYPETFRINDMCQEWVKRGYKVTVLTGIPNYPMGKFFDGYGYTKKRRENWNGMDIIRIPLIPRGTGAIGMMANYASFTISGFVNNLLNDIEADLVFTFEVSPMTQALIGCWYAKKHHVPHYLYVQDLWPENVITVTGISNPAVIKPIQKMVDYIYRNTDEIFATSPSFVEAICNRKVKVPKEKVHYWPQYAEEFYKPMEKKVVPEIPDDDSFKLIFTGNIGSAQGLQILPRTAELLKESNVKFVMVGDGRYLDEFNKEVQERQVENKFIMVPRQPAERIPELLAACDAAFLSFQPADLWKMTIPAKLQSYMACGMSVIASAEGETERVINEAKCGVCCKIGGADSLGKAIFLMMQEDAAQMGDNSRRYFETNFDKKKLMDEMDIYFNDSES